MASASADRAGLATKKHTLLANLGRLIFSQKEDNESEGEATEFQEPQKKQRKRHPVHGILPPRPKRTNNAYTMFLKDYFRKRGGGTTRYTILEACQHWKALGDARKAQFEAMCVEDRARYKAQMSLWKQQRAFVKRSPTAYALFLKDTWAAEKAAGTVGERGVGEMGKLASKRWKSMTSEGKEIYKARCAVLLEQRRIRMRDLSAGNVVVTENGMEIRQDPAAEAANIDEDDLWAE